MDGRHATVRERHHAIRVKRDDWLDQQLARVEEASQRELKRFFWVLALLAALLVALLFFG